MTNEPSWIAVAKSLPFMHRRKITCCGSSPSMIVEHGSQGYRAHCFRNADHGGFLPHGQLSLKELADRKRETENLQTSPWYGLPNDFTTAIPQRNMLWLLLSSIGYDLAKQYGIGYSARTNRVIIPIYDNDELVAFLSRATDNTQPKYIVRYKHGTSAIFQTRPVQGPFDAVITEDCLSAIRVGRYNKACSILGTSSATDKTMSLLKSVPNMQSAAVWLDGDKAGRKGRDKVATQLSLLGVEVTKITTPKDPKLYTNAEIKDILEHARSRTANDYEGAKTIRSVVLGDT